MLDKICKKNNTHSILINHWKTELISHMYSIYAMQLKSGSEYKAIIETVIKKLEYDDGDITVKAAIAAKFFTENIVDADDEIAKEFASDVPLICKIISREFKISIEEYVKRL